MSKSGVAAEPENRVPVFAGHFIMGLNRTLPLTCFVARDSSRCLALTALRRIEICGQFDDAIRSTQGAVGAQGRIDLCQEPSGCQAASGISFGTVWQNPQPASGVTTEAGNGGCQPASGRITRPTHRGRINLIYPVSGTAWQREVEMITPASGQVTHVGVTWA